MLTGAAVLLNLALFAVGVYFEMHPRDRHDLWSAAAVGAVAILNSAALTVPASGAAQSFIVRLRRIALFANSILLIVAVLIVLIEALQGWRRIALHALALVLPPAVTLFALRREMAAPPQGAAGPLP